MVWALPFHQLSCEKNKGNHESYVPLTSNLKISGCPRDRLRAVAQKKEAPALHDPKTATAERRFGDFHQAMHPQRGLGILFLTYANSFGEIHSNE